MNTLQQHNAVAQSQRASEHAAHRLVASFGWSRSFYNAADERRVLGAALCGDVWPSDLAVRVVPHLFVMPAHMTLCDRWHAVGRATGPDVACRLAITPEERSVVLALIRDARPCTEEDILQLEARAFTANVCLASEVRRVTHDYFHNVRFPRDEVNDALVAAFRERKAS